MCAWLVRSFVGWVWEEARKIPASRNIMTAPKIGKTVAVEEENYIFLLLLLTFYLVIVCGVYRVGDDPKQHYKPYNHKNDLVQTSFDI